MNRIALLTSNSRRHRWAAAQLAEVAELVAVVTEAKLPQNQGATSSEATEILNYFADRDEREAHWFSSAPAHFSQIATHAKELPWQGANTPEIFEFLCDLKIDRIFLFGSSIIRDPILTYFQQRVINMHLGLSPYYRGSATNYWPLVDGLPECVGVTVHHATSVVDGGGILAQARPDLDVGDSVHDIGCKTILKGAELLQQFAQIEDTLAAGVLQNGVGKLCRRADFNVDSLHALMRKMKSGMVQNYLTEKEYRDARYPIVAMHRMQSVDKR